MTTRVSTTLRGLAAALALFVLTVVAAPPSFAAPSVTVSATTGLTDGQTVTVTGSGFDANLKGIAVGQCIEGFTGPTDCNLQGGATFRNADASGAIAEVTLKLAETFGTTDCTKVQCVIGVAPLPTNASDAVVAANTSVTKLTFGAAAEEETTAAAPTTSAAPTAAATTTTTEREAAADLPKTGPSDSLPVMLIGASALLLTGFGMLVAVPRRRRPGAHA